MSSDSKNQTDAKVFLTPSTRGVVQVWIFFALLIVFLTAQWGREAIWSKLGGVLPNSTPVKPVDALPSAPSRSTADPKSLSERLSRLETTLNQGGEVDEKISLSKSARAVQKVKAAALSTQAKAANRDMTTLKSLQAEWTALETSLLETDSGRRIVGSPKHLERVIELWGHERPSVDQMVEWETQLSALTEPISSADENATVAVLDEHVQLLSSLSEKLAIQRKDFEKQTRLVAAIQSETSALRPADSTLVSAIDAHRQKRDTAEAERITTAAKDARVKAENEQATRRASLERELVALQARREEQRIEGEKAKLEKLAEEEKAQLAEEATRVEEGRRWAQLEREMNRDMVEIKGLLLAFTADGFTHRPDGTKGPVSFSKIKSVGGLELTRKGLDKLFGMATGNNDRPRGGLPPGVGGIFGSETSTASTERAQALLIKYGELMVRKNMLAP